jgi:hypothetical protein
MVENIKYEIKLPEPLLQYNLLIKLININQEIQ